MLTIEVLELGDNSYQVTVDYGHDQTDVYTTTGPQRTIMKILKEAGVKGKKGRPRLGPKKRTRLEQMLNISTD